MLKITLLVSCVLGVVSLLNIESETKWKWTEQRSSLLSYFNYDSKVYDVSLTRRAADSNRRLVHASALKNGKEIFKWQTHREGAFLISGHTLIFSKHRSTATGCQLSAIDLETSAILWTTDLRGLGPIRHSKYRNRINLSIANGTVTVYGNESSGQYIETVDLASGKTLSNVIGPKDMNRF